MCSSSNFLLCTTTDGSKGIYIERLTKVFCLLFYFIMCSLLVVYLSYTIFWVFQGSLFALQLAALFEPVFYFRLCVKIQTTDTLHFSDGRISFRIFEAEWNWQSKQQKRKNPYPSLITKNIIASLSLFSVWFPIGWVNSLIHPQHSSTRVWRLHAWLEQRSLSNCAHIYIIYIVWI